MHFSSSSSGGGGGGTRPSPRSAYTRDPFRRCQYRLAATSTTITAAQLNIVFPILQQQATAHRNTTTGRQSMNWRRNNQPDLNANCVALEKSMCSRISLQPAETNHAEVQSAISNYIHCFSGSMHG